MFDDGGSMFESGREAAIIRVNADHWHRCRAVALLEAVGGRRLLPEEGTVYRFLTGVARDDALDLVRRKFGWTVASMYDGRPWGPGASREVAEFCGGAQAIMA